ncbi:hypothetical protein IWZ03DRAFT_427573 [Phyllosticta citriasiana]|uniref:Ubiquitin-like protease family profile domain-containing protein n=1 Tax=Phyllosticta citriasiana TaxID=595635 RepID=A0ABR1KA78_9PEZI
MALRMNIVLGEKGKKKRKEQTQDDADSASEQHDVTRKKRRQLTPPSQNVTLSPISTQNHPRLHAPEETGVEVGSEVGRGRHAEQPLPDAIDDDDFNQFHSDSDEEAAPSVQEVKSSPQHSENVNIRRLRSRSFDSSLPRPRKLSQLSTTTSLVTSSSSSVSFDAIFQPSRLIASPEKGLVVVNGAEKDYSVDAIEIEKGLRELADDRWLSHGTIFLLGRIFSFPGPELLETAEPEDNWEEWARMHHCRRVQGAQNIFFILNLHARQHWVVFHIDICQHVVALYDSLLQPEQGQDDDMRNAAVAMAKVCDHDWNNGHWRFVQRTESLESRVAAATAERRRLAKDTKAGLIRNTTKLFLGQFLPHEIAEAKLHIAKEHLERRSAALTAFRQACAVSSITSDEKTGSVLSRNAEEAGQALQHIKRQIRHEKAIRVAADAAQQGKEAERQKTEAQIEKLQNELRAALKLARDTGLDV